MPIDFSLLRQTPPERHLLDSGDVVGVVIKNILGKETDTTVIPPPSEIIPAPSAGRPYTINEEGIITPPMIGDMQISGMTISEAQQTVEAAYIDNGFLNEDNAEIELRLIQPRKVTVHVIRQDSDSTIPLAIRSDQQFYAKHGSAAELELNIYENDVLHALDQTGGLPGVDAKNELWIIRGRGAGPTESQQMIQQLSVRNAFSGSPQDDLQSRVTRIPLRMNLNQILNLQEKDIILNDGDILSLLANAIQSLSSQVV
ncbi:MAG: polysaccharide biosynthesis/export family protein [Planctomycetaceae bacterium]